MIRSERYVRCSFSPPKTRSLSPLYRVAVWPMQARQVNCRSCTREYERMETRRDERERAPTHPNARDVSIVVNKTPLVAH